MGPDAQQSLRQDAGGRLTLNQGASCQVRALDGGEDHCISGRLSTDDRRAHLRRRTTVAVPTNGGTRLSRQQGIDHHDTGVALDERRVGRIPPADLVDASTTSNSPATAPSCDCRHRLGFTLSGASPIRNEYVELSKHRPVVATTASGSRGYRRSGGWVCRTTRSTECGVLEGTSQAVGPLQLEPADSCRADFCYASITNGNFICNGGKARSNRSINSILLFKIPISIVTCMICLSR